MKEILSSLVRHALTVVGGSLVSHGILTAQASDTLVTSFVGIVLILIGVIWGVISKKIESSVPDLKPILDLVSAALAATPAQPQQVVVKEESK